MKVCTDVLILGSGVAGLSIAIKVAEELPEKNITVITKSDKDESNTKYAQGGVAVVTDKNDTFGKHIEDTIRAGDYQNNRAIVEKVITEAPDRIAEIIGWGTSFDTDNQGSFLLGREGGHSDDRIIHHKDTTGLEIERALLSKIESIPNIKILQHHFVIDLITDYHLKKSTVENICYGAYVIDDYSSEIFTYLASAVCIAMGGAGQVYRYTTNPTIATGDGIAIAHRAEAVISDMEFIQFHPTTLYNPGQNPAFLISEAIRGFGAYIKNSRGRRFVQDHHKDGELAPRDAVSRIIDAELKRTGDACAYLDLRHTDTEEFSKLFPNIYDKCVSLGIDVTKNMIPIVPAMHYICGGVAVDTKGRSTIERLYACGESGCTGLHGANRLASNSLLEAIVFAHEIAMDISSNIGSYPVHKDAPEWDESGVFQPEEQILIRQNTDEVQNLMSNYVAIVRSNERLKKAEHRLNIIHRETEDFYKISKVSVALGELRNLITVARIIVEHSLKRRENKGTFFNKDLA